MTKFSFINDKVKLNKKLPVIKQLSLLIAILILLVIAAFAWFSSGVTDAKANGLSLTMGSGNNMLISLDGGANFVSSIDLLSDADQQYIGATNKIKGNLKMEDITSDGKVFYRPVFNEEDGQRIPNTQENWDPASQNRAYITQSIIFRTEKKCDVFMGSGTGIVTSCEIDGKSLVSYNSEEIGNKHPSYNFSNDCIVGALRISAVDSDGNICFVCIPRTDVELVRDGDNILINTGDDISPDVYVHSYYSSNYQSEGAPVEAENVIYDFSAPQKIATTKYNENTGFYEATATVNIWLEGCDPETTRVLSGGKFQIAFDFTATENNTPDPTESTGE